MTTTKSSYLSILALFGPFVALPISVAVGFLIANAQGWNDFSFAVVMVWGVIGTVGSMIIGILLGMLSIVRREPKRYFAWIATVMWPPVICFIYVSYYG